MAWNCKDKRLLPLLTAALLAEISVFFLVDVSGQASTAGFINIDCGKKEDYVYRDRETRLVYTSDFEYIDTGEIHDVDHSTLSREYPNRVLDLRSFPTGIRNCYSIKSGVEKGRKYLVKASFMYGNYDGKNSTPKFDLYLGVNFWTSMYFPKVSSYKVQEIITVPTSDEVSVCLINTGSGTPFISALELRPLPHHLYDPHSTATPDLARYGRTNFGGSYISFPDDRYDRSWFSGYFDWGKNLSGGLVNSRKEGYGVPTSVMQTAISPTSGSTLTFTYTPPKFDLPFHVIFHFQELQELKVNETRIFNIEISGEILEKDFRPSYSMTKSVATSDPVVKPSFKLVATSQSTLPPIINAIELYSIRNSSKFETNNQDVDAIAKIKARYNLQKNWMGDPCSPPMFMWDGLSCAHRGFPNPRIVSLKLHSNGLTGEISASFANLTQLQYLDLSSNGLTGDVPDNLANLSHLKFL